MKKSMYTPCCGVLLATLRHNQPFADRRCHLCRRAWRVVRLDDSSYSYTEVDPSSTRTRPAALRPARHGTTHCYEKYRCRCDACREAKRAFNQRRYGGEAVRRPAPKPWLRGGLWQTDVRTYQRMWQCARKHGITWADYQEACNAVLNAIAVWGKAHQPPVDLDKVCLLALRLHKPLYVKSGRVFENQPRNGPYTVAWPSGLTTWVGGSEGHGRAA